MGPYKNPPVPEGFTHINGDWDTGFVIRSLADRSEFVWIPVGILPRTGVMYGCREPAAFGRRMYGARSRYSERLTEELRQQAACVDRYGGFYLSRYDASRGAGGQPVCVGGAEPWTFVNLSEAKRLASQYFQDERVSSHLPYEAEIDSMLCWLIENGDMMPEEAADYVCTPKVIDPNRNKVLTGSAAPKRGLYDISRNIDTWVQESRDEALFRCNTCLFPQTSHCYFRPYSCYTFTGFRIALTVF